MKILKIVLRALLFISLCTPLWGQTTEARRPNIVFILVDQWRAQATGYAGDKIVITPNLDRLALKSLNVKNAISGMPVCTPFRASLHFSYLDNGELLPSLVRDSFG